MNGMYVLKSIKGTRYEFYWAPVTPDLTWPEPSQEELDSKWGQVAVDISWVISDPRPLHLRAKPLGYELHAPYDILSYPIINGEEYNNDFPLKHYANFVGAIHRLGLYREDGKKRDRYWWASG